MSNVNQELAKIYFEINGFLVKVNDQLLILNPNPQKVEPAPDFLLQSSDLPAVERATVEVKIRHRPRFFPSLLNASPEIFDFIQPEALKVANNFFKGSSFKKILVISSLPATDEVRRKSLRILKGKGIDHILELSSILEYLIRKVRPNKNYAGRDLLQFLCLLKRYQLLKEPQLELFK
ncbi:hypothetical protein KAU86_01555 [bacterium]|nr:hypothetical protein [bacterium]